ncbi:hypothetical protein JXM67_07105 [candidate division WOR-3 bacterium]|nr:hypothetical protein [candidate division WOR-3 bacterium]
MRKFSILALFCLAVIISGCGEESTGPWVWTAEDSLDIVALLESCDGFLSSAGHLPSNALVVEISPETLAAIQADTTSLRYLVSEIGFTVEDSSYGYTFELGIDTTVTVRAIDTLKGNVEFTVFAILEQGSDTVIDTSFSLTKALRYSSWNYAFCDSTDEEWRIAKFSGGLEGTAPQAAFAPRLTSVKLGYPGGSKTVLPAASAGDYAVDGLYEPDELVTVASGAVVSVDSIASPEDDTLLLFVSDGSDWEAYYPGISVGFGSSGKTRLYIIGISLESFVFPSAEWACIVWGIPVAVE